MSFQATVEKWNRTENMVFFDTKKKQNTNARGNPLAQKSGSAGFLPSLHVETNPNRTANRPLVETAT